MNIPHALSILVAVAGYAAAFLRLIDEETRRFGQAVKLANLKVE
jgi:hypothetical protein